MTRSVTSSRIDGLMGCQEPSVRIAPDYVRSDGMDATKILKAGKIDLDPWQSDILCDWMGRDKAGKWVSSTCGGSVPRQNGKSLLVQGRAISGMLLFKEQVIYTAHLQKTATETFEEMRDFFEHKGVKEYVEDIKTALGREQIILKNGARIKFLARTRNGGRGQHGDLLIIDEAQEIDENAQASFLPAISASINPQTLYVGTPPDPTVTGTVFRSIRQKAIDGETSKTSWFEFSVEAIGDITDTSRWEATNPALGRRIMPQTVAGECEQLDPDTFARERLGWWSPISAQKLEYALDKDAWFKCKSDVAKPEGRTAYGVKFSPDGSIVSLCGAVVGSDGKARISLIENHPTASGTRWLSDWLGERYHKACCVVVDGKNGVDVLVDRLAETWVVKNSIVRPGVKDVIASVSLLTDEINEGTLTWYYGQEVLNDSAINAIKRPLGGGYAFGGDNSTPIEAAALALYGVRTSKRNPTAKMRIG